MSGVILGSLKTIVSENVESLRGIHEIFSISYASVTEMLSGINKKTFFRRSTEKQLYICRFIVKESFKEPQIGKSGNLLKSLKKGNFFEKYSYCPKLIY